LFSSRLGVVVAVMVSSFLSRGVGAECRSS
jgi:hypothetical protein